MHRPARDNDIHHWLERLGYKRLQHMGLYGELQPGFLCQMPRMARNGRTHLLRTDAPTCGLYTNNPLALFHEA